VQINWWNNHMFNCIRLCLDVSFLQNTLQHVQVLGNTDFLLVCIENFPGTVQLQITVVIALLDCITSTGGRCGIFFTDVACGKRCSMVCVYILWLRPCAVQKWRNRSRCCFGGSDSRWPKNHKLLDNRRGIHMGAT